MFNEQIQALATIIKDQSFLSWSGDSVVNLIKCVVFHDYEAGVDAINDIGKIAIHTPTILYWDKMNRFMRGVFTDEGTKVKLAEKFYEEDSKYLLFVKKQMEMINTLCDDLNIDYYAQLTRCFLLTEMQDDLYLKLAKYLSLCTPAELKFLENTSYDFIFDNSMMASALHQYGLLELIQGDNGVSKFKLSDFAIALKQNSLNFDEGIQGHTRLSSYETMTPPSLPEYATNEDIDKLLENQEILFQNSGTEMQWEGF